MSLPQQYLINEAHGCVYWVVIGDINIDTVRAKYGAEAAAAIGRAIEAAKAGGMPKGIQSATLMYAPLRADGSFEPSDACEVDVDAIPGGRSTYDDITMFLARMDKLGAVVPATLN